MFLLLNQHGITIRILAHLHRCFEVASLEFTLHQRARNDHDDNEECHCDSFYVKVSSYCAPEVGRGVKIREEM